MLSVWILLAILLIVLNYQPKLAWILFCILIGAFYSLGVVKPLGLLILGMSAGVLYLFHRTKNVILECCIFIFALALSMHWIVGFENLKVLNRVLVSPDSTPYTMYFNFDKGIIPFFLIVILPTLFVAHSLPKQRGIFSWGILCLSPLALLSLAMVLGVLKFEFHIPEWIGSFILANVFFVSLAEEALFRGYLQQRLAGKIGQIPSLLIASLSFGVILHYRGGIYLVIFATLAGLLYGIAWMWSGRLWVSTLLHFGLNLTHLLFFTYPSLRV